MQCNWLELAFSVCQDIKTTISFYYYFQNGIFTSTAELNITRSWGDDKDISVCHDSVYHGIMPTVPRAQYAVSMQVFHSEHNYIHRHEVGLEKWHLPHGESELVQLIFRERFERLTVSLDYLLLPAALIGETHVHVICNQSRKQLQWFILGIQW